VVHSFILGIIFANCVMSKATNYGPDYMAKHLAILNDHIETLLYEYILDYCILGNLPNEFRSIIANCLVIIA
jgi:hypothetical protein